MGGTSTDVTHYAGEYERAFDTEVAGVRLRAPMMRIHTVAAGGGSICTFDGARFRVGPRVGRRESRAGVVPARRPADRHRLQRDGRQDRSRRSFRTCSGRDGDQPLDADVVRAQVRGAGRGRRGRDRHRAHAGRGRRRLPAASPSRTWRNAIKQISVQRGYDVTDYTLCCFGGAGGQHACLVADALGMTRVFIHPLAGVLSAYGMGLADVRALRQQAVEARADGAALAAASATFAALEAAARAEVAAQGIARGAHRVRAHAAPQVRRHRHDARDRARQARCRRRSSPTSSGATAQQYGFLMPGKRARHRGGRGRGDRRGARRADETRRRSRRAPAPLRAARDQPRLHRRRVARRRRSSTATTCARATRSPVPRSSASRTRRRSSSRAGARR